MTQLNISQLMLCHSGIPSIRECHYPATKKPNNKDANQYVFLGKAQTQMMEQPVYGEDGNDGTNCVGVAKTPTNANHKAESQL